MAYRMAEQHRAEIEGSFGHELHWDAMDGYKAMILNTVGALPAEQQQVWATKQAYIALGTALAARNENNKNCRPGKLIRAKAKAAGQHIKAARLVETKLMANEVMMGLITVSRASTKSIQAGVHVK